MLPSESNEDEKGNISATLSNASASVTSVLPASEIQPKVTASALNVGNQRLVRWQDEKPHFEITDRLFCLQPEDFTELQSENHLDAERLSHSETAKLMQPQRAAVTGRTGNTSNGGSSDVVCLRKASGERKKTRGDELQLQLQVRADFGHSDKTLQNAVTDLKRAQTLMGSAGCLELSKHAPCKLQAGGKLQLDSFTPPPRKKQRNCALADKNDINIVEIVDNVDEPEVSLPFPSYDKVHEFWQSQAGDCGERNGKQKVTE